MLGGQYGWQERVAAAAVMSEVRPTQRALEQSHGLVTRDLREDLGEVQKMPVVGFQLLWR